MNTNVKFDWKRTIVPLLLSIFSFIAFAFIYVFFLINVINVFRFCLIGLLFAVPFVIYLVILINSIKGRIKTLAVNIISLVLVPVFIYLGSFAFWFVIILASTDYTENVNLYQRCIRLSGAKKVGDFDVFPQTMPQDATQTAFLCGFFFTGGQTMCLAFVASEDTVVSYNTQAIEYAEWSGTQADVISEQKKLSVYPNSFTEKYKNLDNYNIELPLDFTYYIFYGEGGGNHGKVCFSAISVDRKEVIIQYESW